MEDHVQGTQQNQETEKQAWEMKTVKMSLKKFCQSQKLVETIQEYVQAVDRIVTEAYHLLYLHVLRLLNEKKEVPPLTGNYLTPFLYLVSERGKSRGKKANTNTELEKTKRLLYDMLSPPKMPSRDKLNPSLTSAAIEMEVAIKNNITVHFFKRQRKF